MLGFFVYLSINLKGNIMLKSTDFSADYTGYGAQCDLTIQQFVGSDKSSRSANLRWFVGSG